MSVTLDLLEQLAAGVGRLRACGGAAPSWLVDRIAGHVETLDTTTFPCAAELTREFILICNDEDLAVEEAILIVDERADRMRGLLG